MEARCLRWDAVFGHFMPLLRSLGAIRGGRHYYTHVAPTELSRDGDADFKFLARDTSPTYVDNRALLVANKLELREYKAVFVVGDIEVSQFSDEITVNCAPLV